jgi:ATPase subunit of ABC transporter with duplicated ATPase domains
MSSHQLATTHAEMHQAASAAKPKSSQTDVSSSLLSAATLGFFGFLVHKYLAHRQQRLQTRSLSIAIDDQHEHSHKHGHQHDHKHGHKHEDSLPALVVCGPSGVGKGTLLKMLLEEFGTNRAQYAVSHTTRTPRAGEVNGQHYHFVSASEFEKLIEQGSMLEHAKVHNNYYGRSSVGIQHVVKSGLFALCLFTRVLSLFSLLFALSIFLDVSMH